MADWILPHGATRVTDIGTDSANAGGTTVASSASANTKGSFVELTASAAFDVSLINVYLEHSSANVDHLIDIAVGASGSEVVIFDNLLISGNTSLRACYPYMLPASIPAGTRISARCQASTGSSSARVSCHLFSGTFGFMGHGSKITTIGANTTTSGGVQIDPGAVAGTKGSYTQITSATTTDLRSIIVAIGKKNSAMTSGRHLLDIAIGASSSEVVILPNYPITSDDTNDAFYPTTTWLPITIPSGSRIAARASSSITDATDRLFDVIIYGTS